MTETDRALVDLRRWSLSRSVPGGAELVLESIDLRVDRGEWVGLLGANGSGKSSVLRYLATAPTRAGRRRLVTQDPDEQLVASTPRDELALAGCGAAATARILRECGLAVQADLPSLSLSAGQKQRLQLALALADAPELLLVDEPSALQDPQQAGWVLNRLAAWRAQGGGILMACQSWRELSETDRLVLLAGGRVLLAGATRRLRDHPEIERLLGAAPPLRSQGRDAIGPSGSAGDGERGSGGSQNPRAAATGDTGALAPVVARWQGLTCRFPDGTLFAGVDLMLHAGSCYGLVGPNGCGKSTLLAMAAGLRRPAAGTIEIAGRRLYRAAELDLDHGAALLAPQFPEYFFTRRRVAEEVALDPALGDRGADSLLKDAGLAPALASRDPNALSTGQRRRLAIALVMRSRRPLLLLDEPTAALDRAGRRGVRDLIAKARPDAAVVIASHDRAFLAACGARIFCLTPGGLLPV